VGSVTAAMTATRSAAMVFRAFVRPREKSETFHDRLDGPGMEPEARRQGGHRLLGRLRHVEPEPAAVAARQLVEVGSTTS
jgi:hypothetical protein